MLLIFFVTLSITVQTINIMKTISKFIVFIFFITACNRNESNSEQTPLNSQPCDDLLVIDDSSALNAAKAIDVCEVINARFIRANGINASHSDQIGLLDAFGTNINPRKGQRMLMLSTGKARSLSQPGACGNTSCTGTGSGVAPNGYPQEIIGCSPNNNIYDDIGLEITLTVPENANGFTFDFIFFTFDYPEFICNAFNDQFIVTLDTNPTGSINGNIAFDSDGIPIGVNSNFINPGLSNLLESTGFDIWGDAATTGWIRTSAPVISGQEITLRFIIWDTGDQLSDSSVIIDNFQWTTDNTTVTSTSI